MSLLPFAQLDLPGRLALADGRYLVRSGDAGEEGAAGKPADVLVLRTLGAQRARKRLRAGRPVPLEEGEPGAGPLSLARVTLVRARPLADEDAAERWLERISTDSELARGLAEETACILNRALQAYRVAAPDPYAADVHPDAAVAVRFGYGSGAEVAEGRWAAARELAEGRRRGMRRELLDGVGASERIAGVLGGRKPVSPAESLLSLAELSLEEGRGAEAALLLATAYEAAARRGTQVAGEPARAVASLRERALAGGNPDPDQVKKCLGPLRRSLRGG